MNRLIPKYCNKLRRQSVFRKTSGETKAAFPIVEFPDFSFLKVVLSVNLSAEQSNHPRFFDCLSPGHAKRT